MKHLTYTPFVSITTRYMFELSTQRYRSYFGSYSIIIITYVRYLHNQQYNYNKIYTTLTSAQKIAKNKAAALRSTVRSTTRIRCIYRLSASGLNKRTWIRIPSSFLQLYILCYATFVVHFFRL